MPIPLKELFSGVEGLNESTQNELQTIFEAKVEEVAKEKMEEVKKQYDDDKEKLEEQIVALEAANLNESNLLFAQKLDTFLENVAVSFINENSVAIQENACVEASMTLISNISEAARQFNAVLPEADAKDKMEELEQQNESLRARLNDSHNHLIDLRESLDTVHKEQIVKELSEGLSDLSKEQLSEACMGATYNGEDSFRKLVEGHRFIIENKDEDKDKTDDMEKLHEEDKGDDGLAFGGEAGTGKQNAQGKTKKSMNESAQYTGVDMNLFI